MNSSIIVAIQGSARTIGGRGEVCRGSTRLKNVGSVPVAESVVTAASQPSK